MSTSSVSIGSRPSNSSFCSDARASARVLCADSKNVMMAGAGMALGGEIGKLAPVRDSVNLTNAGWEKIKAYVSDDYSCIEIPNSQSDLITEFRKYVAAFSGTPKYVGGIVQYYGEHIGIAIGGTFTEDFVATDRDIFCGDFKRKISVITDLSNNSLIIKTKNDYRTSYRRYDDLSSWASYWVGDLHEVDFDPVNYLATKIKNTMEWADEKLLKYNSEKYLEANSIRYELKLLNRQISYLIRNRKIESFVKLLESLSELPEFINHIFNSQEEHKDEKFIINTDYLKSYDFDKTVKAYIKMYLIKLNSQVNEGKERKDENLQRYLATTEKSLKVLEEIIDLSEICDNYNQLISMEVIALNLKSQWDKLAVYYKNVTITTDSVTPANPFTEEEYYENVRRNNTKFLIEYWNNFIGVHFTSTGDKIYVFHMNDKLDWESSNPSMHNNVIIAVECTPYTKICRNLVTEYKKKHVDEALGIFTYGSHRMFKTKLCYWISYHMNCGIYEVNLKLPGLGGLLQNKLSNISNGIILFDEFPTQVDRLELNQDKNTGFADQTDVIRSIDGITHPSYPCIVYMTGNSIKPFLRKDLTFCQLRELISIFVFASNGKEVNLSAVYPYLNPFGKSLFCRGRIEHILYFANNENYIKEDLFVSVENYNKILLSAIQQEMKMAFDAEQKNIPVPHNLENQEEKKQKPHKRSKKRKVVIPENNILQRKKQDDLPITSSGIVIWLGAFVMLYLIIKFIEVCTSKFNH